MTLIIVLLCSVVFVSGCVDKNTNGTKTYSQNNISFTYPSTWIVSNTTSPDAVVAVADPKTIQAGSPTTSVVIQKPPVTTGTNLTDVYDANYASFFNNTGFQQISSGNISVNGSDGLAAVYETNNTSGAQKEYQAVWISSNGTIYVILSSSLASDFESQQTNFNQIVNSFKSL